MKRPSQQIPESLRMPLLILLLVQSSLGSALAQEPPFVRVGTVPDGEAFVGQHVRVDVDVITEEIIFGSPKIDLPELEGGVLLRSSTQAVRSPERLNGKDYQQTRYSFAFFPHRPGDLDIPPIRLRFPEETGITSPLNSPPVKVAAKMPEGAEGLSTLVSTTEFRAEQRWSPEPGSPKVGDAFERTITMEAESVLGMGFPPLPVREIDGIAIYTGDPLVEDKSNRGDFSGKRSETITYVCEREGEFEIPKLVIPWFDLGTRELKRVELPGQRFTVAPNPALQRQLESADVSTARSEGSRGWIAPLIAAALIGVMIAFRKRVRAGAASWLQRRRESEPAAFRRLCRATRAGEAEATYRLLKTWLDLRGEGGIEALATAASMPELQTAVEDLATHLFAPRSGGSSPWSGGRVLGGLLKRARNAARRRALAPASRSPTHTLMPLNPEPVARRRDS